MVFQGRKNEKEAHLKLIYCVSRAQFSICLQLEETRLFAASSFFEAVHKQS